MNKWKKNMVTGIALMFTGTFGFLLSAHAASGTPGVEELMGEGIIFSSYSKRNIIYRGDNSVPSIDEMMVEGIPTPKENLEKKYVYDASVPFAQSWASEGMHSVSLPMLQ